MVIAGTGVSGYAIPRAPKGDESLLGRAMGKASEAPIDALHPTQLTVGRIEVADKVGQLKALKVDARADFLRSHAMPAVLGPHGRIFITDHHHLARAAWEAGVSVGYLDVQDDLSKLTLEAFWSEMDRNAWVHPLDENGVRHYYSSIPSHLRDLTDDPYRSLAAYVRNAGGYDKTPAAFAEFVWADFFRRSVPIELVREDFHAAVRMAVPLAHGHHAKRLPGYREH